MDASRKQSSFRLLAAVSWPMRGMTSRTGSVWTISSSAAVSFSFVPMLLFHVFRSAYNFAENTYNNLVNWFGFHDDTLSALQRYTDDMRQKRQERGV